MAAAVLGEDEASSSFSASGSGNDLRRVIIASRRNVGDKIAPRSLAIVRRSSFEKFT